MKSLKKIILKKKKCVKQSRKKITKKKENCVLGRNYGKIKKDSNFQNDIVYSFFGAAI